ncbi:hypothetical protein AV530_016621 [Patagioenas fasciata monilis]|uniref:Uncharacterized protein n=1 Tax=Patagioenas fasciata monilis TaxID=372326 RepID=A0A1V4J3H0_PATFA|nr:hypothetical protein AV530_016621 [Patagioenas fasciata monilis]
MKRFVLLERQPAFSGDCFQRDCSNIASPLLLAGIATHVYKLCWIKSGSNKDSEEKKKKLKKLIIPEFSEAERLPEEH